MGVEELRRTLEGFELVLLDTLVFSYHLAAHPRYGLLVNAVLDAVERGTLSGMTTTVTMAELLTRPAQAGDRQAMHDYELYLTHFPNLTVLALDVALAGVTALVRADTGLRTPDAVHVAAARLAGADAIVTNDRRWVGKVEEPALVMLDDYVA